MSGEVRSRRTLAVFVKLPRPGAVKTRLVPALGAEVAASLYRVLAGHVLEITSPEPKEYERLVFYDPPDATQAIREWLPAGRLRRQAPGDLGRRMADAFARCFARGADRVALIGSDVPDLRRQDVLEAFAALETSDVALGPARDGGYYLVALRSPQPALFEAMAWSTAGVFEATLERARSSGLSCARLRPLRDVDTIDDVRAEWPVIEPLLRTADRVLAERVARALATPDADADTGPSPHP